MRTSFFVVLVSTSGLLVRILCENILEEHGERAGSSSSSEELNMRVITSLGELAMLSYRRITTRLFLLLQSIAFFKVSENQSWPCSPTGGSPPGSSSSSRASPSSRWVRTRAGHVTILQRRRGHVSICRIFSCPWSSITLWHRQKSVACPLPSSDSEHCLAFRVPPTFSGVRDTLSCPCKV